MNAQLEYLSLEAHKQARRNGRPQLTERQEFDHLPMKLIDGVPVFDGTRMRDDQINDTIERLEQITNRRYAVDVRDQVTMYMQSYGRFGLRVKDVCEHLGASKPIVLKYLRELMESGRVRVVEETTRGTGSPRKRYFWTENTLEYSNFGDGVPEGLNAISDADAPAPAKGWSGVIFHGAPTYGVDACGCGRCREALIEEFIGTELSAARRNGTNQLVPGLETRRVRRERQLAADKAVIRAAGLAAC